MLPPRRPVCAAKKTIWRFKVIIQPLMHRVHYCVRLLMLLPAVMSVSVHHMNKWANGLLGPRLLTGREWIDLTLRVWLQLCLRTCPKKNLIFDGFFFFLLLCWWGPWTHRGDLCWQICHCLEMRRWSCDLSAHLWNYHKKIVGQHRVRGPKSARLL